MRRRGLALLAALAACSGRRHFVRPPMPACAGGSQPGVTSRAVTWAGDGWAAVVPEGAALFLREFTTEGVSRGERVPLVDDVSSQPRVTVAWADGAYYVAVAPQRGGAPTRVFRATSRGPDGDAFALGEEVAGELALVPRPETTSRPAALFFEDARGVALRLVARDGEPKGPRRCPADVHPRAVVAWRDGFRAAVTRDDPATGDVRSIDLVALDDDCEVAWRAHVWDGPVNGKVHSLAADDRGTVLAFADREGSTWVAEVDHAGATRVRAARMERHAHSPRVFLPNDASGRRLGVQVVAVRSIETGDRLEAWRLDPDGLLRGVTPVAASPRVDVLFGAPDPWGGGLVGYTREETTHGSARTGAGAYGFFARVCP